MGVTILLLVLGLLKYLKCNNSFMHSYEDLLLYNGADFLISATSTFFVDKTLLIKQFINVTKRGSGLLVLAPKKYGKSTNLNMVKRFLSLTVNDKGHIQDRNDSSNYFLFENNHLKISQNKAFFTEHFGKYPVISIDFGPLKEICSYDDFHETMRDIVVDTFIQHSYLKDDFRLWPPEIVRSRNISIEQLSSLFDGKVTEISDKYVFQACFTILAELSHMKFETHVVVIIDNYDSFVESPLFSKNPTILHFMRDLYRDLLQCKSVERSLVTGVVRPTGLTVDVLPSCVVACDGEHGVWPYYGLSFQELDRLMCRIIIDDKRRKMFIAKVVQRSAAELGGHKMQTNPCSVWSVTQCLEKEEVLDNYQYIDYALD